MAGCKGCVPMPWVVHDLGLALFAAQESEGPENGMEPTKRAIG